MSAPSAFSVAKLVYTIDTELAIYCASGAAMPSDVAAWLIGAEQALWRMFALKAQVPDAELTDALIASVVDVYLERSQRIRKAVREAYGQGEAEVEPLREVG